MAVMTDKQSVAANSVVQNAIVGKTHEFVTEPSIVSLYALGSAAGLYYTLVVGEEVVVEDQEVAVGTTLPKIPYDLIGQGGAYPGDRIIVKIRNSTGGALTAYTMIMVEPA